MALTRALAPAPQVLLLDEPLSALDLKLRKEMQSELKRLQTETGITFVYATHDQEEASTMSDRIGVMSAGKLLQVGTPRDIYDRPVNRFVADFIRETNFLGGEVTGGAVRIGSGDVIPVTTNQTGKVTVAIRPEHISIVATGTKDALAATVKDTTYFGTDTHYHLALTDGNILVARVPSGIDQTWQAGTGVGVALDTRMLQVLAS